MPKHRSTSPARILRQLYFLRNITITFIVTMVLLALFSLNINLPVLPLTIILLIMAVTNLVTRYFIDSGRDISPNVIFIQLLLEIISFSLILYFSGGATNPFTFFYLIPLAVAATIIPGQKTWLLTSITVVLYSLLLKYYVPLSYAIHDHQHNMDSDGQFSQHVLGMWFGFLVSALLVTWFITYLSKELKQRDQAIAEARQRELRDQQMVTLGTLAAGTAHELGTPLASLAVISGEITDGFNPDDQPELFEHQKILRQQISRCKKILSVLSDSAGESRAEEGHLESPHEYLSQIIEHWQQLRPDTILHKNITEHQGSGQLLCDRTITQALINLLNNAADASPEEIHLKADEQGETMVLKIEDNGAGMTDDQIELAGDISFSTKPDGMGIGLFLAITTLRRSGGNVEFKRHDKGGTITVVSLPLIQLNHV
jgi:two-component system sensor histidine kinase RegB